MSFEDTEGVPNADHTLAWIRSASLRKEGVSVKAEHAMVGDIAPSLWCCDISRL